MGPALRGVASASVCPRRRRPLPTGFGGLVLGLVLPAAGCSPGAAPAVLTLPGETAPPSSESETNANPGSIGSASGGAGSEGGEESEGRFTYARDETAVETVGGVVVVLRYDDAAERFVGSATNGNAYGVEVDLDLYLSSHSDEERAWERRLAAGQTEAVSLAVGGSFTRWGLEVQVERESGSGEEGEEGEDESEGRFTYVRDDTATETVGGVVVVLRYDAAARAFVGQVTNTRSYGLEVELEVYVSSGGYDEREWEAWVRGGQTRTVSLPVRSTSFDRWRLEIEVEREDD